MVQNKEKYEQAVAFRKRGFTYTEIAQLCGVSKASVSNWLADKPFSRRVKTENTRRAARDNQKRLSLYNKARQAERRRRYNEAARSAETEFRHYQKEPVFMAALGVYLAGGDTTSSHQIRLSSHRIEAHRLFVTFARSYLGVDGEQLRCWLLLHGKQDEAACLAKWSRVMGVSRARFGRTQRVDSKRPTDPLHFGTLNTIIGSTVLKRKLDRWVELVSKELQ